MSQILIEKAPLILSIAEVRYSLPADFDFGVISKTEQLFSEKYPKSDKIISGEFLLNNPLGFEPTVTVRNRAMDGMKFITENKHQNFTLTKTSLNFQQQYPYLGWDVFFEELKFVYQGFLKFFSKATLSGISLRFINKIEIPAPVTNPLDYFNVAIQGTEEAMSLPIAFFSLRYNTAIPEEKMHAIVNHSLEPHDDRSFPFMLDIDVHYTESISAIDQIIWEKFTQLRQYKNKIFNSLITEKTEKLINE